MDRLGSNLAIFVFVLASFLVVSGVLADDDHRERFVRIAPDSPSGSGNSVANDCGGDFADARASLRWEQEDGSTRLRIHLNHGRPNTLYTVWLRLKGKDRDGWSFGGSPVTGGGSTALASTRALDDLVAATGPGNGSPEPANGFWTNGRGRGRLVLDLDFAFPGGSYPFNRAELSEDSLFQLAALYPDYRLIPMAIVDARFAEAPFTLRIASHCTDDLAHGLTPGKREGWFDWPE